MAVQYFITTLQKWPLLNLNEDVIPLIEQLPEINENKSEGELEVQEILYNDDETIFEPLLQKKKFKSTKPGSFLRNTKINQRPFIPH